MNEHQKRFCSFQITFQDRGLQDFLILAGSEISHYLSIPLPYLNQEVLKHVKIQWANTYFPTKLCVKKRFCWWTISTTPRVTSLSHISMGNKSSPQSTPRFYCVIPHFSPFSPFYMFLFHILWAMKAHTNSNSDFLISLKQIEEPVEFCSGQNPKVILDQLYTWQLFLPLATSVFSILNFGFPNQF